MIYEWRAGIHPNIDANVAGKVCGELDKNEKLTAQDLVDVSRPETAPLHSQFEWDDGIAGEEWRKHQARHIINMLIIRTEKAEPIRAFFKIDTSKGCNKYESIKTIVNTPDKHQMLIDQAFRELQAFRAKYSALKELGPVWRGLDEASVQCRIAD